MRSSTTILSVAALAGIAMASPAPQKLDFAQVASAPTVAVGPAFDGEPVQIASYVSTVAITATATASVTGAATSAAAGVPSAQAKIKRDLEKRDLFGFLCLFWGTCQGSSPSASSTTSSSKTTSATSSGKTSSAAVSITSAASTSAYTPYYPALSTVTAYTTGTTTISSTSACPTTPEEGTYCGFINPEDPCAPQPDGYGPVPTPDTASAFYNYAPFHSMASAAATTISAAASTATASSVPMVYQQTFKDLNGSSSAQSYLGMYTLQTYNAAQCASYCDSTTLCTAFNLFIERDPSVNPTKNDSTAPTVWGYYCPNPASMTSYKCTLWGSNLDASTATNQGQWREDFQVVITGSNGYDKTNVTVPAVPSGNSTNGSGWSKPTSCGQKAYNAPAYALGSKFFPGPYNPQICANYATGQNTLNKNQAVSKGLRSFTPCNMFNSVYYHKNSQPFGTYCTLYNTDIALSWATYSGGFSGSDRFDCKQSHKFTLSTPETGRC